MTSAFLVKPFQRAACALALCAALSASSARAQTADADGCAEGFLERVALSLGDTVSLPDEAPVFVACQPWHEHPGQAIVAIARPHEGAQTYDLQVLLMEYAALPDAKGNMPRILARFAQADSFSVEAMALSGLRIDTSGWPLAHGLSAFGVRSTMNIRSNTALRSEDVLRLYRRDNTFLLPLIDPLVMNATDGVWDAQCAGEATQLQRQVSLLSSSLGVRPELAITESLVETQTRMEDGSCAQREISRTTGRQRLRLLNGYFTSPQSVLVP